MPRKSSSNPLKPSSARKSPFSGAAKYGVHWSPHTRRWAAIGLILVLIAVFPANLHVALKAWPGTQTPRSQKTQFGNVTILLGEIGQGQTSTPAARVGTAKAQFGNVTILLGFFLFYRRVGLIPLSPESANAMEALGGVFSLVW